jgi:hypothetical protein
MCQYLKLGQQATSLQDYWAATSAATAAKTAPTATVARCAPESVEPGEAEALATGRATETEVAELGAAAVPDEMGAGAEASTTTVEVEAPATAPLPELPLTGLGEGCVSAAAGAVEVTALEGLTPSELGLGLTVFWSWPVAPWLLSPVLSWVSAGAGVEVVPEVSSELEEELEELDSEVLESEELSEVGSGADDVDVVLGRPPPWSPPGRHDVLSEFSMAMFWT